MAHYFITGHTGFKGAWLTFLLKANGHEVSGLALDPMPGSIFARTELDKKVTFDFRGDIRNREATLNVVRKAKPDYVIHLAAQALVRQGYRDPRYTYDTNVTGTLNILEAVDQTDSIRSHLIVTTDKVYLNQDLSRPYVEDDPLGGKDPYSVSKAMADILAQEFLSREGTKPGAVARAGNVIGAGDIAAERLMPDLVRAIRSEEPLVLRYPNAIRPWQHVLDCLNGYLLLLDASANHGYLGAMNFGPDANGRASVRTVVDLVRTLNQGLPLSDHTQETQPHEESLLCLDSSKAMSQLGWFSRFSLEEAVRNSVLLSTSDTGQRVSEVILETVADWDAIREQG